MSSSTLTNLGSTTAEAVARLLQRHSPDGIELGTPVVGAGAATMLPLPYLSTSAAYEGIAGGNVVALSMGAARALCGKLMGDPLPGDASLGEFELATLGQAMADVMNAATLAIASLLEESVESASAQTRICTTEADGVVWNDSTPYTITVPFMLLGEPGQLVQYVPDAFVVTMARALGTDGDVAAPLALEAEAPLGARAVRGIPIKLWVELGRTRMSAGRAVALPSGAVVELDKGFDDPVDLYANGKHFATGRLLAGDDGNWAVKIEHVVSASGPESFLDLEL